MTAARPDRLALVDPQARPALEVARLLGVEPALGAATAPLARVRRDAFLLASVTAVLVIQAALPYLPYFAAAFRAVPLDAPEWALVFVIALAPSVLAQLGRALTGQVWVA